MSIVERARIFATAAHSAVGQVRKYTGEPYINHPREVAELVAVAARCQPEMVAAAWLHDCVEDTEVSIELIRAEFGREVGDLVFGLTDASRPQDDRAVRKAVYREHIARQSPACKTIKLADLISNTRTIVERDPEFARLYLQEKRLLLEVLREGDGGLWAQAESIVRLGLKEVHA